MNIKNIIRTYLLIIWVFIMPIGFAQSQMISTSKAAICIAPPVITTSLDMMKDGIIQDSTGKITAWLGAFIAKSIPTIGNGNTCDNVSSFISKTMILADPQGSVSATHTAKFIAAYGIVANIRSTVKVLWVNQLIYEDKNGKKITLIPIKSPMIPIGMKGTDKNPLGWAPDVGKMGSDTIDWHCVAKQCAIAYIN